LARSASLGASEVGASGGLISQPLAAATPSEFCELAHDNVLAVWGDRFQEQGALAGTWIRPGVPPDQMLENLVRGAFNLVVKSAGRSWAVDLDHNRQGAPCAMILSKPGTSKVVPLNLTKKLLTLGTSRQGKTHIYLGDGRQIVWRISEILADFFAVKGS
jgi:hypothetical protein